MKPCLVWVASIALGLAACGTLLLGIKTISNNLAESDVSVRNTRPVLATRLPENVIFVLDGKPFEKDGQKIQMVKAEDRRDDQIYFFI